MVNVCFASTCHHITSTTHGGEAVLLAEAKTTRALRVRAEDALDRAADGKGGKEYSWSTQKPRRSATPGEEGFNPWACDLWGAHARRTVTRVKYLRVWLAGSRAWVEQSPRLPQVGGGLGLLNKGVLFLIHSFGQDFYSLVILIHFVWAYSLFIQL